jgi:DNA-binding Lrp family transcriptional regulator
MRAHLDIISQKILELLKKVNEPLETIEILNALKNVTRTKILYRLSVLRGDGLIKGKQVGSGKGTWIWWKLNE